MNTEKTTSASKHFHESIPKLKDKEFNLFKDIIFQQAGISLSPLKKSLVENRLLKRIRELNLDSYSNYHHLVMNDVNNNEMQVLIDVLTTNETYFFRESAHFDYLKNTILNDVSRTQDFSVWSAASSTGEEPYSLAMVVADVLGVHGRWRITATDINSEVLKKAQSGKYMLNEKDAIPNEYLRNYCLKGIRSQEGVILIDKTIRAHVHYESANLMENWGSHIDDFDVIFIRNVMIYFNAETRKNLISRIAERLKMGGHLFISHSETLHNLSDRFKLVQPSVYVRIK